MKLAVIYHSKTGNTEQAADWRLDAGARRAAYPEFTRIGGERQWRRQRTI